MFKKASLFLTLKKYSSKANITNDVFILSAVRTPIGLINGFLNNLSAPQLGALAIKESLLRAKVPPHDIQNIFIGCALHDFSNYELAKQLVTLAGLPKSSTINSVSVSGIHGLVNAYNFLLNKEGVCVVVGMESASTAPTSIIQTYLDSISHMLSLQSITRLSHLSQENHSLKKLMLGFEKKTFQAEIMEIMFRKEGQLIIIAEDERVQITDDKSNSSKEYMTKVAVSGDGAAALVIGTNTYIRKNSVTPLAKIISVAEENSLDLVEAQVSSIKKALEKADCSEKDIALWEVDDFLTPISLACVDKFNIDEDLINQNGSSSSLGHLVGMSGARIVCHLTHLLPEEKIGCATAINIDKTASAVVIKKMSYKGTEKPCLTLYTKDSCPLCEDLKSQLKPFEGRFTLTEVDIEADENRNIKKLYRYEIPVLFLDGVYLCKHRLDTEYFAMRLAKAEKYSLRQ